MAVSRSGLLKVEVRSAGPGGLALRVGSVPVYGMTAITLAVGVQGGSTYEISVALHDPAGGSSQPFELTTSLDEAH